jgi:hypothetical protein
MSAADEVARLREQIERANNAYYPSLRSELAPSKQARGQALDAPEMIRLCLCSIICFITAAGVLPAQIPDSFFKGASGSDTLFFFESPVPLDLSAVAQSARRDFQAAHPDTNVIRKFYSEELGDTRIPYEASLPPSLPTQHYWVLADSGATEVYPRKVSGTIYIETDPAGWPVNRILYLGSLEALPSTPERVGEPSFVFFSPRPVRVRSARAGVGGTGARPNIRAFLRSRRIEVTLDTTGSFRSGGLMPSGARAFEILETGQTFLSVRWPDGDVCYGTYSLYDITTAVPRFIEMNPGTCGE